MVTPGFLGALVMVGTNVFGAVLAIPPGTRWYPLLSLALSFLFGLAIIVHSRSVREKIVFYVMNSIVILSVATGSNVLGQQIQQLGQPGAQPGAALVSSAFASTAQRRDVAGHVQTAQFFKQWYPATPAPAETSTICLFTKGPRAGQRQNLAPKPPQKIGAPCSDGGGNSGEIVAR